MRPHPSVMMRFMNRTKLPTAYKTGRAAFNCGPVFLLRSGLPSRSIFFLFLFPSLIHLPSFPVGLLVIDIAVRPLKSNEYPVVCSSPRRRGRTAVALYGDAHQHGCARPPYRALATPRSGSRRRRAGTRSGNRYGHAADCRHDRFAFPWESPSFGIVARGNIVPTVASSVTTGIVAGVRWQYCAGCDDTSSAQRGGPVVSPAVGRPGTASFCHAFQRAPESFVVQLGASRCILIRER